MAIELAPEDAFWYGLRAQTYSAKGDLVGAIADYERCLDLKLQEKIAGNATRNLTRHLWLLATSTDDAVRDPAAAKEIAERLCEDSDWKNAHFVAVLAAAHPASGEFVAAVKFQELAVSLYDLKDAKSLQSAMAVLESYRQGKAIHETGRVP